MGVTPMSPLSRPVQTPVNRAQRPGAEGCFEMVEEKPL